MAKLPKGILGPLSGKVGPVVGATWRGVAYIRARPRKKKRKKKVKSTAQLANEAKFKFANRWMVPFHPYLIIGFQNMPEDKPAISMAFSVNYHQAVIGSYPDFEIDFSKVVLSTGDLPNLYMPVIMLSAPDQVALSWQQKSEAGVSFDDQVMLVLYNRELELADGFIGGIKRSGGKCSFRFDPRLTGKALDVYVSVTSADRKKIAGSLYLGRIAP